MKRGTFETMGDKHKAYELREVGRSLMPGLPVVVRVDGRAFHTFTKGLARPYDERLSRAMVETAKFMVEQTNASMGYTQSDEITLVFPCEDVDAPLLFGGRVQKWCSLTAAMATAKFNQEVLARLPEKARMLPLFDSRVFQYPTLELAADNLLWREADATRNSLSMAAHSLYSHKELHKAGYAKKHEMLFAKGVNWNDYPAFFKRGTYVRREAVCRQLDEATLAKIPEQHRQSKSGMVMRKAVTELEMPPLSRVENLVGVVCRGEQPVRSAPSADVALD